MAENKQYIRHVQDNGTVMISEDVVASIITLSVKDVEGVVSLSIKPGADIADMFGKKNWGKGMKIQIAEDNTLSVSCNILMKYDHSVVEVATAVQSAVTNAVESMTGVKVTAVDVNVCGIVRQ